jgi:hypothetical protein
MGPLGLGRCTRGELLAGGAGIFLAGPAARVARGVVGAAEAQAASGADVQHFVSRPDLKPVGFANSGGLVFVDESAEEITAP